MPVSKFLDEAKEALNVPSDYALAKKLGIHSGRIAEYRQGKSLPDAYVWVRLGIILNRDPMAMQAEVELERETRPERRQFWTDFLSRAARVLLLPVMALHCIGHSPVELTSAHGGVEIKSDRIIHYAK